MNNPSERFLQGAPCGAPSPRKQRGFTLIELMITVGIVAILAGIAWPMYSRYVIKTRRAVAAGCLNEAAQFLERHYTTNMSYLGAGPTLPACSAEITKFYKIALNTATVRDYQLSATPTALQKDTLCGTLGLNSKGVRTAAADVRECW